MKTYVKIAAVVTLLISVFACGKKSETVFLEKDGKQYEVSNQVSFYYPKDFQLDATADNKDAIRFIKDQEVILYATIIDDTDNRVEDMPELYAGQLEEDGASDVGFKNLKIASGLNCQEFTGIYSSTGIKFKHMVYFTSEATYSLSYQAPQKVYDERIVIVSQFLESLTVHHETTS